ncbi:SDR family oxidoreductase [Ahrensia sp. R2A130]|uniref:SDR family oxidoreductase n=1 Tax=Ahrensia sp. R2A130 TaxID=744979 RepID=UPI0001E0F0F3|nr:SDR family oxidoreductase [Ahrensia sp. R2A130]EFL89021.1 peroxisomal multifunctional enzyme A [Ahrensia sp. R2A130]
MSDIRYDGQVIIVTGSGNGLGRNHAIEFAKRGAKVVVNDFGGARDGTGGSSEAAEAVVKEIKDAGGEAIANGANVTDRAQVTAMVQQAMDEWGRIDVLVNNAGILRDRSFGKMTGDEWDAVVAVHLTGSANCSLAVWNIMKEQGYGRIVMTTSTSGIYGNFGQANYGAAKAGVWGLMNTLHIEGAKNDIRINCISPTAATRMTEDVIPEEALKVLDPKWVTPAVLFAACKDAPSRTILLAGAGGYSVARLMESEGVFFENEADRTPEQILANWEQLTDMSDAQQMMTGSDHVSKMVAKALGGATSVRQR